MNERAVLALSGYHRTMLLNSHNARTTGVVGLIAGLLLALVGATPAAAFTSPGYPSVDCTPVSGGINLGLAPQQWNSAVGLPLTPSGTPAAQRIVIGEFDEVANVTAVNLLMAQCGLDAVTVTNHTNTNAVPGLNSVGLEATLDVAVAAAALPPNTSITLVNSPLASGWYGLFVNMAQACGLEFVGNPWSVLSELSVGPNYPAGGCIISLSYGGPESVQGTADRNNADFVISELADLGVVVAVSAGDEGSGGCFGNTGTRFGNGTLVSVNSVTIASNIATFTTTTLHGFALDQSVFLAGLPDASADGMYRILAVSGTTFSVGINSANIGPVAINSAASVNFGTLEPQYPATNPNVLAVGGTQWNPQSISLVSGLSTPYTPGTSMSNYVWWDNFPNPNCANLPNYPLTGGEATGGGQSSFYAMPSYQQSVATANYPALPARRMMPDVAALAGWPMYGLANPGISIIGAEVASNVATIGVSSSGGFSLRETITVSGLPAPFVALNGTHTISAGSATELQFTFTAANIPAARVASGSVSQSCTPPGGSTTCTNTTFPWFQVSGTSAATPLVATGIANVNAVLSARGLSRITNNASSMDIHSLIYSPDISSALTDVTSGSNDIHSQGGYNALTGFDMVSGMGVPNFATLANLLIARLTPSDGGGGAPAPSAPTPQVGNPVVTQPAVIAPAPVQPVMQQTPLGNLGSGVLVSSGPNSVFAPRIVVRDPAARTRADAPRLSFPVSRWRVAEVQVPGGAREFTVQIQVENSWKGAGTATSNARGKVLLPSIRMTRAGDYPVRLIDSRGRTLFVVIRVVR